MTLENSPLFFAGFTLVVLAAVAWMSVDTIRALRTGKARFEWFVDNRAKGPIGFWFNIAIRGTLIALLLFFAGILWVR
jgi:hypothetical protein